MAIAIKICQLLAAVLKVFSVKDRSALRDINCKLLQHSNQEKQISNKGMKFKLIFLKSTKYGKIPRRREEILKSRGRFNFLGVLGF